MKLLILLIVLYGINLSACAIYCHHKKNRKTTFVGTANAPSTEKVVDKQQNKRTLKEMYINSFSSLLRMNLAITALIPSHRIRNAFYRFIFAMTIERKAVIYYGAEIRAPWMISIGEGSVIGDKSILDGRFGIQIGKNVNFSTGVWLWTLQHDVNDSQFSTDGQGAPIVIGDRAWLSCRTVVLPGVTIGEGSVIAAGAVVTKDTEPFSINGGIPSKKLGNRNKDLKYEFDGSYVHFL